MVAHCSVMQFLSRSAIECNDLEELFIKDQSLTNESEYFFYVCNLSIEF